MSKKPTIVLVHGAFHQPEHFRTVADLLRNTGYKVLLPRLPSVGLSSDPGNALHLDAAAIQDVLNDAIVERGEDVVLVMHSYGGLAGTEGYGMFRKCIASGQSPDSAQVRRLVYLAAHGAVEKGTVFKPQSLQLPHLSVDDKGIITHTKSFERFYEGDCSRKEAQPAIDMCLPMASSAMGSPTRYAAWKDYGTPCTYIKCLKDRAVLPEMCDTYIARMRNAGVNVDVEMMQCGHSPAHVAPKELAELIARIAG